MAVDPERAFDVVVVGGANVDYLVKGAELPKPGATVTGQLFQEASGGKGANQAVAIARLGGRAAFIACVGSDQRGEALVERLVEECVDTSAIVRHSTAPTGVALIAVDASGEKQIVWAPGANERLTPSSIAAAADLFTSTKIVLLQLEIPFETVEAAIRLARAAGVRVVLDPAPAAPLREAILRDVHVIRPNAFEAWVLTGIEVRDRTSARRAADNLIRRGVRAACVGAPGGNLLVSDEGETWLPHLPVEVVDATGAGDAFAGALALALAEGSNLAHAARFAHAASALATTKVGAQAALPRRDAVMTLLGATEPATATGHQRDTTRSAVSARRWSTGARDAAEHRARELDVVVLGNAHEELVVRTPRLPSAGEVVQGDLVAEELGGKGIRQAIAAARLGSRVALVSRVGADPRGDEILSRLRAKGVRTEHVTRDPDARTGIGLVHVDRRGRATIASASGDAMARPSLEDVRAAETLMQRSSVLVSSLALSPECLAEAFRMARRHGTQVILDAEPGRKFPGRLLRLVDIAVVPARDCGAALGARATGRRQALDAARSLLRRGARAAILRTRRATLLLTRNDEIRVPSPHGRDAEALEADDAFCSTLASSLAEDADLVRAATLASAAAALVTARYGEAVEMPTRAAVARLARESLTAEELTLDGVLPADAEPGAHHPT